MHGMSEMYTSLLCNTHIFVVAKRVHFSAEKLTALIPHVQSNTQFVNFSDFFFPVHFSLDSGSDFPFAIWKFPEITF